MFELTPFQSQMMLVAGMMLLGWFMFRQSIRRRRISFEQWQQERAIKSDFKVIDQVKGVPLATAPPETQRWMVEMFDLQRELKAELDTKIVVIQALIRQADLRMAQLHALQQAAINAPVPQSPVEADR